MRFPVSPSAFLVAALQVLIFLSAPGRLRADDQEDAEKAARFGARGRKIVEEKFSLASQLNKTLELYGV